MNRRARALQAETGLSYTTALGCIRAGYRTPRAAVLIAEYHWVQADGVLKRHDGGSGRHPSVCEADEMECAAVPTRFDRI